MNQLYILKKRENIMPKGSEQLTNARKEEIINACAKLYTTMNFKDITLNRLVLKQPLPALLSIITFRQKKRFFWHYFRGSMTYGQPISDRFSKNMK